MKNIRVFLIIGIVFASLRILINASTAFTFLFVGEDVLITLMKWGFLPIGISADKLRIISQSFSITYFILLAYSIICLIVHIVTLCSMKKWNKKEDTIAQGILNIVFGLSTLGFIGGILILCLRKEDFIYEEPIKENPTILTTSNILDEKKK